MNKSIMKYTVTLLFIILIATPIFAQPGDRPFNQEPGKCYAKCQLPDLYEEEEEIFKIYIEGANAEVKLDSIYFSINDNGDWIYVGFENDLSIEQVEMKLDFEKVIFLVSEVDAVDYIEETVAYKRLVEKGNLEWKEVICGDKIDSDLFIRIQLALMEKGYLEQEKPITILSTESKTALRKYQEDHGLPMGQMDVETLRSLGL